MSVLDDVTENDFLSQLDSWLGHNPNEACSKGGHAAYGSAVYQVDNDFQDRLENGFRPWIPSSNWDGPDVSKGLVLINGRSRTNKDVYTTHFKSISLHRFVNFQHKNIMISILVYHLEEDSKCFRNWINYRALPDIDPRISS